MVNSTIINTAEKFISKIPKNLGLKKSYIFGSYAKGNQRDDSDIDIAVVFENNINFNEMQLFLMKLRRKIDLRIEPHPFCENDFNTNNPFANEIQKTGFEIII